MMSGALNAGDFAHLDAMLTADDLQRHRLYSGDVVIRQPIHTVYVPADRIHRGVVDEWREGARAALRAHAPGPEQLATATGLPIESVASVWDALLAKLQSEPIEDLRVDLEDGYGTRPDDEEDGAAVSAGLAVAQMQADTTLPPYVGVRAKSLEGPTRRRGIRSLDLIIGAVLDSGRLPGGWVITLPKVTSVAQVQAMVELCRRLERGYALAEGTLRFEIQVETAQAILGPHGTAAVAPMIHAAEGRCSGLHFGTYDYTAGLGIAGGFQRLDHPAADHAKLVMQLAAAGTGARVSDGSSNIVPVGDESAVHSAWAMHAKLIRRSLERGVYQGWDLHPAQLPTRYLANYLFYLEGLPRLSRRLGNYLRGQAPGGVLDEPATAKALAGCMVRGVNCGAVAPATLDEQVGFDLAAITELAGRRFG